MEVFCLLANLTGGHPPGIVFQDCLFTAFPVNRLVCKEDDLDRLLAFRLYTKSTINDYEILTLGNDTQLSNSQIDFNKPTVLFVHGFLESADSDDSQRIKNNYLANRDGNVILVDARYLFAGPWYITSSANVQVVGEYTAKFIDYLVDNGLKLADLHLVGMSLGGQTVGVIGSNLKSGKARRVTGLDPAGPLFYGLPKKYRIDADDGEFVDIIHSNAGIFGYNTNCGQADFWLNGGTFQPGCSPIDTFRRSPFYIPLLAFCNHWRSYQTFAESLLNGDEFPATQCSNVIQYKLGQCKGNEEVLMGEQCPSNATGTFYLSTPGNASYII